MPSPGFFVLCTLAGLSLEPRWQSPGSLACQTWRETLCATRVYASDSPNINYCANINDYRQTKNPGNYFFKSVTVT
eukprot:6025962-Amphidinium_carterae.1